MRGRKVSASKLLQCGFRLEICSRGEAGSEQAAGPSLGCRGCRSPPRGTASSSPGQVPLVLGANLLSPLDLGLVLPRANLQPGHALLEPWESFAQAEVGTEPRHRAGPGRAGGKRRAAREQIMSGKQSSQELNPPAAGTHHSQGTFTNHSSLSPLSCPATPGLIPETYITDANVGRLQGEDSAAGKQSKAIRCQGLPGAQHEIPAPPRAASLSPVQETPVGHH